MRLVRKTVFIPERRHLANVSQPIVEVIGVEHAQRKWIFKSVYSFFRETDIIHTVNMIAGLDVIANKECISE